MPSYLSSPYMAPPFLIRGSTQIMSRVIISSDMSSYGVLQPSESHARRHGRFNQIENILFAPKVLTAGKCLPRTLALGHATAAADFSRFGFWTLQCKQPQGLQDVVPSKLLKPDPGSSIATARAMEKGPPYNALNPSSFHYSPLFPYDSNIL